MDVVNVPLRAIRRIGQLFPGDRHRYAHTGAGTRRERRNGARAAIVAQIVDEYAPAAVLRAHLRAEAIGQGLRHMLCGSLREGFDFVPSCLAREGDHDVQPFAAARLAPCFQSKLAQQLARQLRRLDHPVPTERGIGVEIEHNTIWFLDIGGHRVPRMQLNRSHLSRAHQCLFAIERDQRRMAWVQALM